ncbi:hypothetical protein [Microbacterium sp. RURRCA19A]|uniref:hypothetical protein n=1 Tax=Microbacterium sp. RURRCA19A TaxID=1907391 RepID=UPI000971137E|nr:hypothetical protein [Microbacterium sp. RURRCA19A]
MSTVLIAGTVAASSALFAGCASNSAPPPSSYCDTERDAYVDFVTQVTALQEGGSTEGQHTSDEFAEMFTTLSEAISDKDVSSLFSDMADFASRTSDGGVEAAAFGDMSFSWPHADTFMRAACTGLEPDLSAISTPEPTEEPPAVAEPSPSFGVMTGGGYTYTIAVDTFSASATSSVTHAPPGKTDLTIDYNFTATLTNTTAGRTLGELYLPVIALSFPASSAICTTPLEQQGSVGGTTAARTLTVSGTGCTLVLNTVSAPSAMPTVNQSVTLHSSASPWKTDGGAASTSTMFYRVDEAVAPTLANEVQGASLVVGYTSQMVGQRSLSFTPEACTAEISNATSAGSFTARIGLQGNVQICQ